MITITVENKFLLQLIKIAFKSYKFGFEIKTIIFSEQMDIY